MFTDPTFWTAVAFVVFIALIAKPVGKRAAQALDARADRIQQELDEAEKLREEAQQLLAKYQRMQRDAKDEAEQIVKHAKDEAERIRKNGEKKIEEALERRERQAMDRIRQAELQAEARVRAYAVDVAMTATEEVLKEQVTGAKANKLVDDAIGRLPDKLN